MPNIELKPIEYQMVQQVELTDGCIEKLSETTINRLLLSTLEATNNALKKHLWIPCSEKLPSNDDFVIITILDEHGDTKYRYSSFGWYLNVAKCWIVDDELRNDVVAWAPLPEPYKGE